MQQLSGQNLAATITRGLNRGLTSKVKPLVVRMAAGYDVSGWLERQPNNSPANCHLTLKPLFEIPRRTICIGSLSVLKTQIRVIKKCKISIIAHVNYTYYSFLTLKTIIFRAQNQLSLIFFKITFFNVSVTSIISALLHYLKNTNSFHKLCKIFIAFIETPFFGNISCHISHFLLWIFIIISFFIFTRSIDFFKLFCFNGNLHSCQSCFCRCHLYKSHIHSFTRTTTTHCAEFEEAKPYNTINRAVLFTFLWVRPCDFGARSLYFHCCECCCVYRNN